ncbi:MAG: ADP compounds hydrolase NudE [Enterobacteriaceae bacterium]
MDKHTPLPRILNIEKVAESRLFKIEKVDLLFSNGERRLYERMSAASHHSVMIVPVIDDHLLLIREYAVGIEGYELGFPKGVVDEGEGILEAANRELMEEVGFGATRLTELISLNLAPAYFSGKMSILLAQDLYPQWRQGDEPEPLQVIRWPLNEVDRLLQQADFREARSVSALFLAQRHLASQ